MVFIRKTVPQLGCHIVLSRWPHASQDQEFYKLQFQLWKLKMNRYMRMERFFLIWDRKSIGTYPCEATIGKSPSATCTKNQGLCFRLEAGNIWFYHTHDTGNIGLDMKKRVDTQCHQSRNFLHNTVTHVPRVRAILVIGGIAWKAHKQKL